MTYTIPTPSTVSAGDTFPASAYNIISNNLQDHEARIVSAAMTGMVSAFAGVAAPTGWLLCDGTAVSRSTYSALFAVTGTTYGVGDGSTTFNVPNLKGRTVIGVGVGTEITGVAGVLQGAKEVTLTSAQSGVPAHAHSVTNFPTVDNAGSHSHGATTGAIGVTGDFTAGQDPGDIGASSNGVIAIGNYQNTEYNKQVSNGSHQHTISADGSHNHTIPNHNTNNNTVADAASAHTNIQPSIPLTYIIKY